MATSMHGPRRPAFKTAPAHRFATSERASAALPVARYRAPADPYRGSSWACLPAWEARYTPSPLAGTLVNTMLENANIRPTLAVTDLKRAKEFYGNKLGLKEIGSGSGDDAVYQGADGTQIYLYKRDTPAGSTATCASFEVQDVERTVQALRNNGIRFEEYNIPEMGIKTQNGVATMGDMKTAWFKDPDGNILAIGNEAMARTRKGVAQTRTA